MKEPYPKNPQEVKGPPSMNIIIPNALQARAICRDVRNNVVAWREKDYGFSCPPEFNSYLEGKVSDEDFDKTFDKWYKSWDPNDEVQRLQNCNPTFQKGVKAYQPLQDWGFFIPDQYNVVITPCSIGIGGGYRLSSTMGPTISMYYRRNWEKGFRTPEGCLLHEAYHIGIEKFILEFGLNQDEKERIVDICSQEALVPSILPKSHLQQSKKIKELSPVIDPFLAMKELPVPERLRRYKNL
ncbi:MAG: hypothetical protein HYW86_03410 [Candidatus Roizmanbacteria bacterium]|nr:MAG: hypothetical protein HYW86_03410 [Candidatus Roizmanbacteria bacterium]